LNYQEFLNAKVDIAEATGFDITAADVNQKLKPHQKDAIIWAVKGDKRCTYVRYRLILERLINRYSNKGDVVFDPFAGLFTVPKCAVEMGRYGIGTELNVDYFRDGVGYLKNADIDTDSFTLFDLLEVSE